jgi:hypothetical protein
VGLLTPPRCYSVRSLTSLAARTVSPTRLIAVACPYTAVDNGWAGESGADDAGAGGIEHISFGCQTDADGSALPFWLL